MTIYAVTLACILISYCLCRKFAPPDNRNKIFCILSGVLLALLMALRDWESVGVDLLNYYRRYLSAVEGSFWDTLMWRNVQSILYFLLSSLCSVAGVPYQLYVSCCSVFFVGVTVCFLHKHTRYPLMSILIYLGMGVFTFQFSGLKQSFAMAFGLLAYHAMTEKRDWLALLWILLAALCHPTAVVLLPLYLLSKTGMGKKLTVCTLAAVIVVCVFRMFIGAALTKLFNESMTELYTASGSLGGTAWLLTALWAVYLLLYWQKLDGREKTKTLPQAVLTLSVMIQVCSAYGYMFTRLNLFYVQFLPVAVSEILSADSWERYFGRFHKAAKALFVAAFGLLMVRMFFSRLKAESLNAFSFMF